MLLYIHIAMVVALLKLARPPTTSLLERLFYYICGYIFDDLVEDSFTVFRLSFLKIIVNFVKFKSPSVIKCD